MSGTEEWTGRREAGRVGLTTMVNVIKGGSRDERTGDTVGLALGDDAQQCRAGGAQDIEKTHFTSAHMALLVIAKKGPFHQAWDTGFGGLLEGVLKATFCSTVTLGGCE